MDQADEQTPNRWTGMWEARDDQVPGTTCGIEGRTNINLGDGGWQADRETAIADWIEGSR